MEEILIAVKNKEIDEDSALDIMLEFIEKSKEIKVKNILKLLSKNLLSLENASKMINAMSNLNDSKYNNAQKSNYYEDDTSNFKLSSKKSISNVKELKTKQKRAARPLEKEEYDEIMELCKNGFEYYDNGKKRKFRPNEQLAMTFLLQANLGLRISDVLTLTPSTVHKQLSIITNYLKLSNISSHSFRKLYSMTVYNSTDGDIELLKELLNHSSIATTQKYIRRTQDEINKVSASIDFTYSW
ncbi:tyrosine-type recombinase/integrase [Clostridium sp. IBUN22A]|uniref:tyrosine-type recombinase/integrase n=1 Tax=Clostridium sp. IBUN22A TaxID=1523155 RepID=UPI0005FBD5A5|nr:tyrosine-type recombinase/integrase [Clostridium sp. IBUN22A]